MEHPNGFSKLDREDGGFNSMPSMPRPSRRFRSIRARLTKRSRLRRCVSSRTCSLTRFLPCGETGGRRSTVKFKTSGADSRRRGPRRTVHYVKGRKVHAAGLRGPAASLACVPEGPYLNHRCSNPSPFLSAGRLSIGSNYQHHRAARPGLTRLHAIGFGAFTRCRPRRPGNWRARSDGAVSGFGEREPI